MTADDAFKNLMQSPSVCSKILRFVIFAPIGAIVGWFFWLTALDGLEGATEIWKEATMYGCMLFFGLGAGSIPILRCLTFITFVTVFFGEGQAIVNIALMIGINNVFVKNMFANMDVAYQVIRCNMLVAQNLTLTKEKVMVQPNRDLMHHLALGSRDSRRSVNLIEDVFEPLRREIISQMETKRLEKSRDEFESVAIQSEKSGDSWEEDKVTEEMISSDKKKKERKLAKFRSQLSRAFTQKLSMRCENIFFRAHRTCWNFVLRIYDSCQSTATGAFFFPAIGLYAGAFLKICCTLVHPQKICIFFKWLRDRDKMCYESNVALPREMSETENELIESTKVAEEVLEQFEVNVQLEANIAVPQLKMFSLPQAFSRIRANFSWLRATINTLFFILKIVKLIYLGRVVIIIYLWIRNYLKDVAHENNMVGDRFFLIDQRRKMLNKQCLDVLRKFELKKVHTSWFVLKMSKDEKTRMMKSVVQMVYLGVFIYVYTVMASTFYRMLMYAYEYSTFTAHQYGYQHLEMKVIGGGFVAQIFRGVLKDFNRSADVNQSLSNDHCRREPTEVNWSFFEGGVPWIWFVFSLLFLQKIFASYVTRLRLLVASTTFPQRDYVRNLWIYNNMLEIRLKKFYVAKESMESWVENPYLIPVESAFDIMYRKYSKMKFILRFFATQACFICGDRSSGEDPRRYCRYHKTYFCQNCLCGHPCFGMCYACRVMPWFQEFDFDKKSEIDYDLATRAGYIVCRRATNSTWQYFLFQQSPKFTDWAPPYGLCGKNEKLFETADRVLERDLELEGDEYENLVDFEALIDILDGKGRKTDQMVCYFAAILDDEPAQKDFSLPETFVDFDWVDIERACKLVGKQNLQPALLKLDYFLRKYMSK